MKRYGLLALGVLASIATSRGHTSVSVDGAFPDTGGMGCDDMPAVLCVEASLDGEAISPDSVEVQDADQSVLIDLTEEACTWDLETGSYVVVGVYEGETVAEPVLVENSMACDHETVELELVFGAGE